MQVLLYLPQLILKTGNTAETFNIDNYKPSYTGPSIFAPAVIY